MSKIYEALLRAEQDRAAAAANQSATPTAVKPVPVAAATEVLEPVEAAPVAAPWVPAAAPVLAPTSEALPESAFAPLVAAEEAPAPTPKAASQAAPASVKLPVGTGGMFDFSRVPAYEWKPSLQQLPSLEARGSSVEQFRALRSRMQEFRDLNTLKSILVSSGLPQEGKSFVTANLALSFASYKNSRVLLIDGDMRRSSLHHLLGAQQKPGLSDYLAGSATLLQVMQRAKPEADGKPLPPGLASITFIGGGGEGEKAADLSGNQRFGELIAAAAPFYDWIVVDSSPVNLVTDGVNLARSCDGVLLITRGGVTKYKTAQRALTELKASKILGVVLNAVEKPPVAAGYYGYDGYDGPKPESEPDEK
jgi:protein-tyrosine kinase